MVLYVIDVSFGAVLTFCVCVENTFGFEAADLKPLSEYVNEISEQRPCYSFRYICH